MMAAGKPAAFGKETQMEKLYDIHQKEFARLLGDKCRWFRKSIGKRLRDVAHDTGYSIGNVSAFENGKNNNMKIYLWYVAHGLSFFIDYSKVFGGGDDNGKKL